ncbi:MAG: hypothetical protein ACYDA2_08910 [Acidimicrobiales bacterium]
MSTRFPFAIDRRFLAPCLAMGFRPRRDGVEVTDDGRLVARFSIFKVETPLSNVDDAHVTRGYRWWTAVGARLSFVDDGLTFGTTNRAGVCLHFRTRVPSLLRASGHSALTVTVEDLDALVAAVRP